MGYNPWCLAFFFQAVPIRPAFFLFPTHKKHDRVGRAGFLPRHRAVPHSHGHWSARAGGGANCVGSSSENGNCNTQICIPGGLKRQVCPNFGIKHFRLGIIRQPKGQKLNGVLKSHLKYFTLPCPKHGRVCTPSKTQNNIFVVIFFFTAFVSMIAGCYFQKASDFLTN